MGEFLIEKRAKDGNKSIDLPKTDWRLIAYETQLE